MTPFTMTMLFAVYFATFDIGQFVQNVVDIIKEWGGWFIIGAGAIMLVVAIYMIAKGLIMHGKTQVNWFIVAVLFIVGGALLSFASGLDAFAWVQGIAEGGKQTIEDLGGAGGTGTPTPTILYFFR